MWFIYKGDLIPNIQGQLQGKYRLGVEKNMVFIHMVHDIRQFYTGNIVK